MAFESDWVFLRAALPDLQAYLLSREIYWPLNLPARSPYGVRLPQLTIGNLLLSAARLRALERIGEQFREQRAELDDIARQVEAVRNEWRAAWGRKAAREYSSRLNLWSQYLRDLQADLRANAASYLNEVRHRAILRLLVPEMPEGIPQDEVEQINQLDEILRGLSQPGPFVWESEVESAFPWDGFWFLHVVIRK